MTGIQHGTPEGYRDGGCRTAVGCPAVIPCRTVYIRYQGDQSFRRAIDSGVPLEDILAADAAAVVADVEAEKAARRAERVVTHAPRKKAPAKPRRPRTTWTAQNDVELLQCIQDDLSLTEAAARMHKATRTLLDRARMAGLSFRNGRARVTKHGTTTGYKHGCHRKADCPADPSCAEVTAAYQRAYAERRKQAGS